MYSLHLGDCLEVMRGMADNSVDAVVTDPPYKLSQEYSANVDDNLLAVAAIWIVAQDLFRICKPGALAAIFYDMRILPLVLDAMRHAGWKYVRGLTLYRRWGNAHKLSGWMSTSDFILLFTKPGAPYQFYGDVKHDVYIKAKPEIDNWGHPAQKPLECVRHIVANIAPPDGIVIDPYMGSNTTGEACALEDRNFIGIEQQAIYFQDAQQRIEQATQARQLTLQEVS
jgi:site-specific DNA-methyltransferase (adenine-specific)